MQQLEIPRSWKILKQIIKREIQAMRLMKKRKETLSLLMSLKLQAAIERRAREI